MTFYNFVNIRTSGGRVYSKKILNSVQWINANKYPEHDFNTYDYTIEQFLDYGFDRIWNMNRNRTIIHPRCANPNTGWTDKLRKLQNDDFKVVNSVDTIELTSNKLACSLHLQGKVNHPKSWEYSRNMTLGEKDLLLNDINDKLEYPRFVIAKPLTSIEQGANVRKIDIANIGYRDLIYMEFDKISGNKIVIQEYIPYTALHRVIVIGGKALPYTFIDKPEWHKEGDWKVSCCLNKTTMRINDNEFIGQHADRAKLFSLAEETQRLIGGVINFIDIFETKDEFTISEINTACNLSIHEKLAKLSGRKDWNIHYRIARQLIREIL